MSIRACLSVCLLAIAIAPDLANAAGQVVLSDVKITDATLGGGVLFGGDQFGLGVAGLGDLDGNGVNDVAIAARFDNNSTGSDRGAVYILKLDNQGGVIGQTLLSTAPAGDPNNAFGGETTAGFGQSIAWLDDYDGDGNAELAIGEHLRDAPTVDSGRIWIVDIDSNGVPLSAFAIRGNSTNFTSLHADSLFGYRLENLGDWDSDGAPEIAVTALKDNDGGADNGAVYILYLDPSPAATAIKGYMKISATQGGFDGGFDAPTRFGSGLANIGDHDADGQTDLAIGASQRGAHGSVYILFMDPNCQLGPASCVVKPGSVEITEGMAGFGSTLQSQSFGFGLAWIDEPVGVIKDRLVVGNFQTDDGGTDSGSIWILSLSLSNPGQVNAEVRIGPGMETDADISAGDGFGVAVAPIGDLNGDGYVDIVVGSYTDAGGGSAYLMTMNPERPLGGADPDDRVCAPSALSGDGLVFEFEDVGVVAGPDYFANVEPLYGPAPGTGPIASQIDYNLRSSAQNMFGPFSHDGTDFTARFSGYINMKEAGDYVFSSNADDGVRIRIGSDIVLDQNRPSYFGNSTRKTNFPGAGVYPIEVFYFDSAPCCNGLRVGAQGPLGSDLLEVVPGFNFDADLGPTSVGGGPGTTLIPQSILFSDLPADCQPIVDSDFDSISDYLDNCPDFFNPGQEDQDGDGVGDYCDNCRRIANPGQESTIEGWGDACYPAFILLQKDSMSVDPAFDLRLACGGVPIEEINLGLRLPFGVVPASADFGGGCDEPVVSPAPGIPTGLGCVANADLGSNVDPAGSGAYGPGLASPFSSETVYVQLRGNGVDGRLCDPYAPTIFLGRFTTGPAGTFSGLSAIMGAGIRDSGLEYALDTNGNPAVISQRTSGAGDPDLEILLQPADGEDEATATRWSLCISEFTDQRMHRISAGLRVPGASIGDLRVEGCDATPDGGGIRDCDADLPNDPVGPTVDQAVSFTAGPYASPTAPVIEDTLYVVVEGSAPAPGATTLNPTQFQEWCVATIEVDAPPGTAGVPPEFVVDGLATLPYSDATAEAWQTSSTLLVPLSLEQVALDNGFDPGDDLDGDGVLDDADNCRFIANVDVVTGALPNNGDVLLAGVNVDNDGDACECGDANGSGAVFDSGTPDPSGSPLTPDLDVIRAYLVGSNTDPAVATICSVSQGPECNTTDAVVLQRALNTQAPGINPQCDAALPD